MRTITLFLASAILLITFFAFRQATPRTVLARVESPHSASATFGWAKNWGGSSTNYANVGRVAIDEAENIYAVGEFQGVVDFDPDPVKTDWHASNTGSIDAFLSKFDSNGTLLWAKTWGGTGRDVAYGDGVDNSGNVYVVGPFRYTVDFNPDAILTDTHTSNANSENNIYLSKFASDGTFQWVRTWGPALIPGRISFGAEAYNVTVDGNYLYVVGDFSGDQTDFNPWGSHDWHTNHPPAIISATVPIFFDAFLSKFDLNGNFQWAKTWGGEGYDDGPGIAVDGAGNLYVAGMYASQNINFDPAGGVGGTGHPAHDSGIIVDVFLSKFDASGNYQWVRTWGGQGTEDATGIVAVDRANNVYVAGRFASINCDFNPGGTPDLHSSNGNLDAFLSKFDSGGAFQWAKTFGGSGGDEATGLAVDRSGNVYAAGRFHNTVDFDPGSGIDNHTSNGGYDVYFSQFDSNGKYNGSQVWGGSGDDFTSIAIDRLNKAYAFGEFVGTVDLNPGNGIDHHTSYGASDAFLIKFLLPSNLFLPWVIR